MSREEGIELAWYAKTTETSAAMISSRRTTACRFLKSIVDFIVSSLYEDSTVQRAYFEILIRSSRGVTARSKAPSRASREARESYADHNSAYASPYLRSCGR